MNLPDETTITTTPPLTRRAAVWKFLKRWQEPLGWMPLNFFMLVGMWLLLGKLPDPKGYIPPIMQLVLLLAYATAAQTIIMLALRRLRRTLTPEEKKQQWQALLDGKKGAIIVYLTEYVAWALITPLVYWFFWPSR